MSDLPEGWAEITLDAIGRWRSGGTPSRKNKEYFGGRIPWVKSGDLNDGIVSETEETITDAGVENSSATVQPAGTVSVAMYGATIGRLGILGVDAATNQACANCQVNQALVEPRFLFHYLRQQRKELIEAGQGGAQPNISAEIIRAWAFPLPPLPEQKRIVAKVEALLAEVNAARERLEKVPAILKRFRQSVLAAACSGRLTDEWRRTKRCSESGHALVERIVLERRERTAAGRMKTKSGTTKRESPEFEDDLPDLPLVWTWARWNDLADWITYGFTRPMPHVQSGIPIVTARHVADSEIDFERVDFTTPEAFEKLSDKDRPKPGEILVTKDGSIGRAAVVRSDRNFCINQSVAVVRFGGLSADPDYLCMFIEAPLTQKLVDEGAKGSAIRHISITAFGEFPVAVPPLEEQQEIVRRVTEFRRIADWA